MASIQVVLLQFLIQTQIIPVFQEVPKLISDLILSVLLMSSNFNEFLNLKELCNILHNYVFRVLRDLL